MASITALQRQQIRQILASQSSPSTPPPPPIDDPGSPSGVAMPASAPAGWTRYYGQDFKTDSARGEFLAAYYSTATEPWNAAAAAAGNGLVNAFPTSFNDTRSKLHPVDGRYGKYDPANIRTSGGSMFMRCWYDATLTSGGVTGHYRVVCPVPLLGPKAAGGGGWGHIGSSRRTVRARANGANFAGIKIAWLGWPLSGHSTNTGATAGIPDATSATGFRGGDGEWDFPEKNAGTSGNTAAFVHFQNVKTADSPNQVSRVTSVNFWDNAWHTWTSERIVGSYNVGTASWVGQVANFFVDDVQIGTTLTSKIPMTPMSWRLQTETIMDSTALANPLPLTTDAEIELDWITVDVPA